VAEQVRPGVPGGPTHPAVVHTRVAVATAQRTTWEIRDGKIVRETIYVSEPFDPPDWRLQWRAAP
jgi:hypothetical protein